MKTEHGLKLFLNQEYDDKAINTYELYCQHCGKTEIYECTEGDAIEAILAAGWMETDDGEVCGDCLDELSVEDAKEKKLIAESVNLTIANNIGR